MMENGILETTLTQLTQLFTSFLKEYEFYDNNAKVIVECS